MEREREGGGGALQSGKDFKRKVKSKDESGVRNGRDVLDQIYAGDKSGLERKGWLGVN